MPSPYILHPATKRALFVVLIIAIPRVMAQYTPEDERQVLQLEFEYRAASFPDCNQQTMLSQKSLNLAVQCDNVLQPVVTFPSTCPVACQELFALWGPTCASEYYSSSATDAKRWAAVYDSGAYPSSQDIQYLVEINKLVDKILGNPPVDYQGIFSDTSSTGPGDAGKIAEALRAGGSFITDGLIVCGNAISTSGARVVQFNLLAAGGTFACWVFFG